MTSGFGRNLLGKGADVVMACAALVMVTVYLSDRVAGTPSSPSFPEAPENWREEIRGGIVVGATDSKLTIVEFMDFECPFCARWAARVDSLITEFPGDVQLVVQHFPVPGHVNALPAAVAVECAVQQGSYLAFQRALFADQRSFGTKPWVEYAADAGMPNIDQFRSCVDLPADSFPRIAHGLELGERTGIRGTPTVWINGIVRRATLAEMRAMLK